MGVEEDSRKSLLLLNVTVCSVASDPLLAKVPLPSQPESVTLHRPQTADFLSLEAKWPYRIAVNPSGPGITTVFHLLEYRVTHLCHRPAGTVIW